MDFQSINKAELYITDSTLQPSKALIGEEIETYSIDYKFESDK